MAAAETYGLGIPRTFGSYVVPLAQNSYEEIRIAHDSLMAGLGVEEIFDVNFENYYDFEKFILNYNHKRCFFSEELETYWLLRLKLSRFVMNFLSSSRSYLDYVPRRLTEISSGAAGALVEFETTRKKMYAEKLGYRVLESLRNYTQHRSMPIHNVQISMSWEDADRTQNLHSMVPQLSIKSLKGDGKFKQSVLQELELLGDQIPFMPLMRAYMDGLGIIHDKIRNHVNAAKENDLACYERYVSFYKKNCAKPDPDLELLLSAGLVAPEGFIDEGYYMKHDISGAIRHFQSKNKSLGNISTRFVSSLI